MEYHQHRCLSSRKEICLLSEQLHSTRVRDPYPEEAAILSCQPYNAYFHHHSHRDCWILFVCSKQDFKPLHSVSRSITVNEMREEKITLGITTLLSMSILIFMVSDKMPSTSSFVPLIGWFYTCMMLLIAFATLCSSFVSALNTSNQQLLMQVINIQKKGLIGQRPSTNSMRWARRVGRYVFLLKTRHSYI